MNLRCSRKDLIQNQLTLCLFNHEIKTFDFDYMINILLFKGNMERFPWMLCFDWWRQNVKIKEVAQKFGAEATRIALAAAAEILWMMPISLWKMLDSSILQLSTLEMWAKDVKGYHVIKLLQSIFQCRLRHFLIFFLCCVEYGRVFGFCPKYGTSSSLSQASIVLWTVNLRKLKILISKVVQVLSW